MQQVIWKGFGVGSMTDPYVLVVEGDFDKNLPFSILVKNPYDRMLEDESYFVFSNNIYELYVLALLVNTGDKVIHLKTKNSINYTLLSSDQKDIADGPYTLVTYNSINYLIKQQIFSNKDFADEKLVFRGYDDSTVITDVKDEAEHVAFRARLNIREFDNLLKVNDEHQVYVDYKDIKEFIEWEDILNKPETFKPSQHNHPIQEIDGLTEKLQSIDDTLIAEGERIDIIEDNILGIETNLDDIEDEIVVIKDEYVTKLTFDLQLKEKQNNKPDGINELIINNKINDVYMDNLYVTDIEEVETIFDMLELPDMKRGDICIVEENNSTYILSNLPSDDFDNWKLFRVQPSVVSVNGKTGIVHIGITDIENLSTTLNSKLAVITYENDKLVLKNTLSNKVDKLEGNNLVYATSNSGEQIGIKLTSVVEAATVVQRTTNGNVRGAVATADQDLVPLGQLNTLLDTKADKTELSQVYGGKNLAIPDLAGKEYLGDGEYLFYKNGDFEVFYNVYSGYFEKKTLASATRYIGNFGIEYNKDYVYQIIGSKTNSLVWFNSAQTGTIWTTNQPININISTGIITGFGVSMDFIGKFKLQLEKGDTATPYTLPMYVTPELLDIKVDKVSGKGLSENNFTTSDKNKLDGIEAGAEKNPYSKDILDAKFEEKANDDEVVKLTGEQQIDGAKTFRGQVNLTNKLNMNNTGIHDLKDAISPKDAINKSQLDTKVSKTTFDMQMLEKLNIKPNGNDLLIVDNKISPIYMDSLFITDIEEVDTLDEMLALTNLQQGDICIVQEETSSYVLKALPSSDINNWSKLLVQPSVISVAGKTGIVVLGISDINGLNGALNERLLVTTFENEVTRIEGLINNKANDNEVVKTTGDQLNIDGNKLFTNTIGILDGHALRWTNTSFQNRGDLRLNSNRRFEISNSNKNGEIAVMTDLDTKADKTDLSQVYGGKNLAIPDLIGKEYLGGGVYNVFTSWNSNFKYNIFNGLIEVQTTGGELSSTLNVFNQNIYSEKDEVITISIIGDTIAYTLRPVNNPSALLFPLTNSTSTTITIPETGYYFMGIYEAGQTLKSYKIQLEKGDTATPYTLPMVITPELLDTKVDKVSGKGLSSNDFTNALKTKLDGLDNKFDDKADKTELSQVYGGKNLAIPDLEGKEYLGDGEYLLISYNTTEPFTLTYNIYDGIYTFNGLPDNVGRFKLGDLNVPVGNYVTMSFIYISGTSSVYSRPTYDLDDGTKNANYGKQIGTYEIESGNNLFVTLFSSSISFDNYKVKLQIEKGSTATPYTLPMYVTPELLDTKADKTDLAQVYGGNNSASPDLEGKEYLGEGVYRLFDSSTFTVDYDVMNGVITPLGQPSSTVQIPFINNFTNNVDLTYSIKNVGTEIGDFYLSFKNGVDFFGDNLGVGETRTATRNVNNTNNAMVFISSLNYNGIKYLIQLEKGDTATAYTLPMYVTPELLDTKVDKSYVDNKTTIKEQNKNTDIKFWTGTQAEYDSLSGRDTNTLYFIEEE